MEKRKQLIANFVEHRSPVGGGVVDQAQARGETQPGVDPKAVATLIVASLEGAPMMSRIQRSDEALQRVKAHLNRYSDEEVAGS